MNIELIDKRIAEKNTLAQQLVERHGQLKNTLSMIEQDLLKIDGAIIELQDQKKILSEESKKSEESVESSEKVAEELESTVNNEDTQADGDSAVNN